MSRLLCTLAAVAAAALIAVSAATAGASPSDSQATLASPNHDLLSVLATPLFLPGEVDASTLGVAPTALASVGLTGAAASSAGDGPNMFIVDDDHAQCPNAQFTSIEAAVQAAGAGDQIKVCPGRYTEQVTIDKPGLTLFSQVPLQAVIQAPPVLTTLPNSIVTIAADNVTLRQFTITGPFVVPGCAEALDRHTGVRVISGSATIYGNHITQVRDLAPGLFGCQDGIAVQVGRRFQSQVGQAVIRNNLIDQYQKGGVVVDGPGSYAWVTQNQITGEGLNDIIAQNGVQVGRDASADVDHNEISRNQFFRAGLDDSASGVLLFETANHVSVDHNDVFQNGLGIDADGGAIGLTIDHNDVYQNINSGLVAFDSAENVISYNKSHDNTPYDCEDDTVGQYPPGVANHWIKDMGLTQNRPGLCKH